MIPIINRQNDGIIFVDIFLLQHSLDHIFSLRQCSCGKERIKQFILIISNFLIHQLNVHTHYIIIQPQSMIEQPKRFIRQFFNRFKLSLFDLGLSSPLFSPIKINFFVFGVCYFRIVVQLIFILTSSKLLDIFNILFSSICLIRWERLSYIDGWFLMIIYFYFTLNLLQFPLVERHLLNLTLQLSQLINYRMTVLQIFTIVSHLLLQFLVILYFYCVLHSFVRG